MAKENATRAMFGLTQLEMSKIFGITRSHWAGYERGLRNLPHDPAMLLTEMITYMISPEGQAPMVSPELEKDTEILKKAFEKMLKENEYQIAKLDRQISMVKRKMERRLRAWRIMDFLRKRAEALAIVFAKDSAIVSTRVANDLSENGWVQLTLLNANAVFLKQQNEWLHKELKK